jgi:hypothetical protein
MGLHEITNFSTTKEMDCNLNRPPKKWENIFFSFIYSHVHTLFGPLLPPALHPLSPCPKPPRFQTELVLPSSPILLKRKHKG